MKPLFEVGEVVVLQSKQIPHYNGEYVVTRVLEDGDVYECRVTKSYKLVLGSGGYAYLLDEPLMVDGSEGCCAEQALKKKHTPGEMDFKLLVDSLKSYTPNPLLNVEI